MSRKSFVFFCCVFWMAPCKVQATSITLSPELRSVLISFNKSTNASLANQRLHTYMLMHPKDGNAYTVRCLVGIEEEPTEKGLSKAVGDCEKGIQLSPKSIFTHLEFANVLRMDRQNPGAIIEYSAAIDLGLRGDHVFEYRCRVFRRIGMTAEALADCNRQVLLTPSSYSARIARGKAELASAEYMTANRDFVKAGVLEPFKELAFELQAEAEAVRGRYAAAAASLTQAISLDDKVPMAYFQRAMLRMELGEKNRSLSDLEKAKQQWAAAGQLSLAETASVQIRNVTAQDRPLQKIAASGPVTLFGQQFTGAEVDRLMHGLYAGFDPFDQTVNLMGHYVSTKKPLRWVLYKASLSDVGIPRISVEVPAGQKGIPRNRVYDGAILEGLAASGYAGGKWKALYDEMFARDKRLPSSAADTYLNRRALADSLAKLYGALAGVKHR